MAITKRKRFEVFKRDRFTCCYCGRAPPVVILEVDHVVPRSRGGNDGPTNLITSCRDCNRGKADIPLSDVIPGLQERIAEGQERLAQLKAYNRLAKAEERERNKGVEEIRGVLGWDQLDAAETGSIRLFLQRLPLHEVAEAASIAASKRGPGPSTSLWKYFCGVCWTKIKRAEPKD